MSDEPGILPEPEPFGKYYLLERISVGGMAEIYKAKAFGVEGFERLLAVKKILSSIAEDEDFIDMFVDEAKIAGQLNHPNIAQIYDLGKVEGSYYIALEYISGKDMKTIFERARRVGEEVDIPQVCHVVMKVCEGLAHAHNKTDSQGRDLDIVHRDISPQNILISYEGEVKIIDFGIAKAQGKTSQTQVGVLKGKFSYMSPEQVRGLHVDHRSDIFSLGIVLYEMLTLERLFLGESDFDTLEKIRKVEMSPPSLYNPNIPKELEDIVLKALEQNPDDRFQSTEEFAEALERFMRNQDYYYKNTDLAEFMKDAFREDLEFEQKKLEYYQSLDLDAPDEQTDDQKDDGGLVWDEDEMETQIFDESTGGVGASPGASGASQPSPRQSGQQSAVNQSGQQSAVNQSGQQPAVNQSGQHSAVSQSGQQSAVNQSGGQPAVNQSGQHSAVNQSGGQPAAGQSGAHGAIQDGRDSGAVEVVGPDNTVDTIGPEEEVDPVGDDENAPTVEFDRMSVEDELEDLGAELGEGEANEAKNRRKEPTSEVPAGTVDAGEPVGQSGRSGWNRWLVIGGTAAASMVAALAIVFVFVGGVGGSSSSKATIEFAPSPKDVSIFIDGKKVHSGETPYTEKVEPGETTIQIKKKGYKPFERTANLEAGTPYEIKQQLERLPENSAEVVVETTPSGADVAVDGSEADGTTPVTVGELSEGEHEIVVTTDGYYEKTETVDLIRGESKKVTLELTPKTVALTVQSDPTGAEFSLQKEGEDDPIAEGETPETVEELDGQGAYAIEFQKDGRESKEITWEPGTEREDLVEVSLEASGSEASEEEDRPTVAQQNTEARESDPGGAPSNRNTESSNDGTDDRGGNTDETSSSSGTASSDQGGGSSGGSGGEGTDSSDEGESGGDQTETASASDDQEESSQQKEKDKPKGKGTLLIQSKPAAKVHIDGRDTGQHTPVMGYKISAGKHRIVLTNEEFGLKKTYYVDISPGETKKIINQSK